MSGVPDTHEVGARVEALLAELTSAGDLTVAARAEELVALLVEFYGAGLARIVERLDEPTLHGLLDDELVSSLLILHELHPQSTEERVLAALEKIRPYLGSHAGDVEYLGLDDGGEGLTVRLALAGSCDGCPSSAITVKHAIERAIEEIAPEVAVVEVQGVVAESAVPEPADRRLLPLHPVQPAVVQPAQPVRPVQPVQPAGHPVYGACTVPVDAPADGVVSGVAGS